MSRDIDERLWDAAGDGKEDEVQEYIRQGADVNCVYGYWDETPLHHAAKGGHENICKILLDAGAQIEPKTTIDETPLHHVAEGGYENICKILLDAGAQIDPKTTRDETPLHHAAKGGHENICKILLDAGAQIEPKTTIDETPLHHVAEGGYENICKILLDAGAQIDPKTTRDETPLHHAAKGGHENICKILLDAGAQIEPKTTYDETPLHHVAEGGYENICKILLDAGAQIDPKTTRDETPLHHAAKGGHENICKILLDAGAQIEPKTTYKKTPLHFAAERNHDNICTILLDAGSQVNLGDSEDKTALHLAAEKRHGNICTILLDASTQVNLRDRQKRTPLHYAAENDMYNIGKRLLEAGSQVNLTDVEDQTALHLAAKGGLEKICSILLDASSQVDLGDSRKQTPLHLATERNRDNICTILLDAGSQINLGDSEDKTALHLAAENAHGNICTILLDAGSQVNLKDARDQTALHLAARGSLEKICSILLDAGSQVDLGDSSGNTPLHYICKDPRLRDDQKLIISFIHAGSDITVKNKDGHTALDYLFIGKAERRKLELEYKKSSLHRRLMTSGSRPVDVVKVFLCGDPSAGKTTLKTTLTKKLTVKQFLRRLVPGSKKHEEQPWEYTRTPGIDVCRQSVKGVGQFLIWDCAGQIEYSVTHGMFMGCAQSLFLVVYNITQYITGNMSTTKFWLPFIKASKKSGGAKPKIVLVATHADELKDRFEIGLKAARRLMVDAKDKFSEYLDIDDEVMLVDTRDENSEDMEKLKRTLKRRRKEIIGAETLPKLCDDMLKRMKTWKEETVPVISWSEFLARLRKTYSGMDKETLRAVTEYLHIMGDVYWAELAGKDDQVILEPQWFTTEIIGRIFAGIEFASQQTLLPPQPFYSQEELCNFFTAEMETTQLIALLDHMDLVHATNDGRYLIPGKLPEHSEKVTWKASDAYDVKGTSIQCADEVDIFNPSVFPLVQKKILDLHKESTVVSRSAVKCILKDVDVFVQLTKIKDAINVAVMCHNVESLDAASDRLQSTVELIEVELVEKSAGTNLRRCFVSHAALRQEENLQDVWSFTEDTLVEAEKQDGNVRRDATTSPEDVTSILFKGYDDTMLRYLGPQCRIEWLPVDAASRCFGRLDVTNEWREDYRGVAKLLGIADYEREDIVKESDSKRQSVTGNIIKRWCVKKGSKMTIGMLQSLLAHMSLVDNAEALIAIEEVVDKYPGKDLAEDSGSIPIAFGISDHLVRWRRVLKRKITLIKADMVPSLLTGRLYRILPLDMCTLFESVETSNVKDRMRNAKTLVLFLLERDEEEWPRDLLTGLQETDQSPLAQALQEDYDSIAREEQSVKEKKKNRRRDMPRMEYEAEDAADLEIRGKGSGEDAADREIKKEGSIMSARSTLFGEDVADPEPKKKGSAMAETLIEKDSTNPGIRNEDIDLEASLSGQATGGASSVASGSNTSMTALISQFQNFTGCTNPEEAQRCLRNADMNIQEAVDYYFNN